jgi:outer membrane receptor protein involved in Fe transport
MLSERVYRCCCRLADLGYCLVRYRLRGPLRCTPRGSRRENGLAVFELPYPGTAAASRSSAFFGQARWTILPALELAAGARWTHETKNAVITQISVNPIEILGPLHPIGSQLDGHYPDSNVSPEATLT